jgi:fibronectin-binding autotransporter adhesin
MSGSGTLGSTSGTLTANGGTLDLNATSQTVGALNGTSGGTIKNNSGSSALTVGNGDASGSYAGVISSGTGTLALTKTGAGTQTLTGANTYTGDTLIGTNGGTLKLDSAGSTTARLTATPNITVNSGGTLLLANSSGTASTDRINNSAAIKLNGGIFNLGGFSEGAAGTTGVGALTLTATSTINFGTTGTNNLIQFSGLSAHTASTILQITNWEGTAGSASGNDRLLFAGTSSSFTGAYNQNDVTFNGTTGYGVQDFSGFYEVYGITAVPEPGTWIGAALALLAVGLMSRKRFIKKAETLKA